MPGFYLPSDEEFDPETDDFVLHCLAKERQYRHFDLPLSDEDRIQKIDFSSKDARHRFLPLLGYTDITRKFVRDADGERQEKIKKRPIRFAGHEDAAYLQAYADHLAPIYESALRQADATSLPAVSFSSISRSSFSMSSSECRLRAISYPPNIDQCSGPVLRGKDKSWCGVTDCKPKMTAWGHDLRVSLLQILCSVPQVLTSDSRAAEIIGCS